MPAQDPKGAVTSDADTVAALARPDRSRVLQAGRDRYSAHQAGLFLGLLLTVVLLSGFQGPVIIAHPLLIAPIAVPIIIQSCGIVALGYAWAVAWKVPHKMAAACALIGASRFFELVVAVAAGLFGLHSGAALAIVASLLVEVPVMLSLVAFASRTGSVAQILRGSHLVNPA